MRAYFPIMTANNKQRPRKQRSRGIAVGNRFRVDAYFESQKEIERIDQCAAKVRESRSRYVTNATLQRVERELCGGE